MDTDDQAQQPLHVPHAITNTERPRQIESSTIYQIPQQSISHIQPPAIQYDPTQPISHIPQQSIQHTQPPSLQYDPSHSISHITQQYRQTQWIENMETDAIDYHAQQPLHVPQAITHSERPRQTDSSTIYHIPQQSIRHTQP